jgi:hypothetical protein
MTSWPGAPLAAAVELLALEGRGASGEFRLGRRNILLQRGRIVGVSGARGVDPSLTDFLIAAGRLSETARLRLTMHGLDGDDLERAVIAGDGAAAERSELRGETLRESLRSVWMERLARAFSEEGEPLSRAPSGAPASEGTHDVAILALVLDALERCAGGGDAEVVGARAQEWVRFAPGPAVARAKRWAQIEAPREVRVASVLSGDPAAAARLAALGRAGFLEILPGANQGPPPPAPSPIRRSSRPPAARPSHPNIPALRPPAEAATAAAAIAGARSSLTPPRAARVLLAPGAARVAFPRGTEHGLPRLTLGDAPLADPLDGPEDQVAALEETGASSAARARAWRIVAEVARERLGALDEHARAAREAAAADPDDPEHLRRAADACAAIEETELALAFGKAVVGVARSVAARARAMHDYALLCRRLGRREEALQASRAATQAAPDDPGGAMLSAELELSLGRHADAARSFADAAGLLHEDDPARAHLFAARAYRTSPTSKPCVEQLAGALVRAGLHDASIELRAELARLTDDPDERRRLLLVAAERAELHGTPLGSAALLLEAFDADPSLEVVWAPLETDLASAGARRERAIVLEEIALAAAEDVGEWWARAADARGSLEPDGTLELELRTRALVESPASSTLLDAVGVLAERTGLAEDLLSALDRAVRSPRADHETRRALAEHLAERAEARHPSLAAWAREVCSSGAVPATRTLPAGELTLARLQQAALEPAVRAAAIAKARAQLEAGYDAALARALLVAARNEGLDEARAEALGLLALHATSAIERTRLRGLEAAFARWAGHPERASAACRDALAHGHSDAEIGTRLRRLRVGDSEARSLALAAAWAAEAAHSKGPLRARALAELACLDEARGQVGRALELAAEALREDRACARAALLFLRRDPGADWQRFGPEVAQALRDLLGETPETLRALALTASEPAEALAMTVRWASLDPVSHEPLFVSLALSERHALPEYDDAAIDAIVSAPRCEPLVVEPLLGALDRIAPRDPKRALDRALRAAAALGPWGHALRARAFEIALAHRDQEGIVRAAESQLASPPGDRASHLRRIARLRRDGGDTAGEARTWVRLLATVPRDDGAIRRLAEIYAATGERERLVAVLSLRVEEGTTSIERAIGHLELAAVHAQTLGAPERAAVELAEAERELDALGPEAAGSSEEQTRQNLQLGLALVAMGRPERGASLLLAEARRAAASSAVGHYESAIAAMLGEPGHLPRALEICEEALERCGTRGQLLLAFEQVSLDLGDLDAAERVYARLIARAVGAHGRRALVYRRARWLDRAGAARRALEAYVEACQFQASPGALSAALDRLARAQGELTSLARGLRALAENAAHPTVRLALVRRAADVMSSEIGDPRAALELLASEWRRSFSGELEGDLARALTATHRVSPEAAGATMQEIAGELERRAADAWMGEERAHILRKAVRLYAGGLGDLETGEAYAWRAVAALRDENAEPEGLRAPLDELATLFRARGQTPDVEAWVLRAVGAAPSEAGAATEAGTTTAVGALAAETVVESTAVGTPAVDHPPVVGLGRDVARSADGAPSSEQPARSDARGWSPAPAPGGMAEVGSDHAVFALDAQARATFVADPRRMDALLRTASAGVPKARLVAQRILAAAEPDARERSLSLDSVHLLTTSLEFFRHPGLADALMVLRRVWENAIPLFKTPTKELGILGTDRVGPHDGSALGKAVQSVGKLLSLGEPVVYQSRDRGLRGAQVLRTVPPSIRVPETLAKSPAALHFELGRALELATPERVLVASLSVPEGRNLFAAISAAFGPAEPPVADGRSAARNRDIATLAADLWSTLPPLAQKSVRELLGTAGPSFDYDTVALAVSSGAARLGLVACADPRCAVLRIAASDPLLAGLELRGHDALAEALERSPLLRDLARFALSDGFLDALSL